MNIIRKTALFAVVTALASLATASSTDIWSRPTMTDGFWGLNDALEKYGLQLDLGLTQVHQANVRGGISTHRRSGRYTGSYDLELYADLQKLLGVKNALLYVHTEGAWSLGIDGPSAGTQFGVNADILGYNPIVVTELYYEQDLFDDTLELRFGKFDITGGFQCRGCAVGFDTNRYANDETAQFLNNALVNNPTIPFPGQKQIPTYGVGAIAYFHPHTWWYASAGVIDEQANPRTTGFSTAFGGEDFFLYLFEGGIFTELDTKKGPLLGTYRAGTWIDAKDKQRYSDNRNHRNDIGVYLSCDQMLTKENDKLRDTQGLGAFFRYGWAPSDRNEVASFFSVGMQYRGLIETRDQDVIGFGMAHGTFSDQPRANEGKPFAEDHELAWELYYNAQITPWFHLSPSIQYIKNPEGNRSRPEAIVLGLRTQMTF